MTKEVGQIDLRAPVVKPFRRVSPSRYTAMQSCLLREVWAASGTPSLLPPSPLTELGSVIHHLLEAAGRGQLGGGANEKIESTWHECLAKAEGKMALSFLSRHLVPLSRSISDFQVRKLRACHRAKEIAHNACRIPAARHKQSSLPTAFELWVESEDGFVGGYIDRVMMTKRGVILCDYKSGTVLDSGIEGNVGQLKQAYKVQMGLYAALYHIKYRVWPIRLNIVPLQGDPVDVHFEREYAKRLLSEASMFLNYANKRIEQVLNGKAETSALASPLPAHCRFCLFRPACVAYWIAKRQKPEEKWPVDVQGFLREMTRLHNGNMCIKITETDLSAPSFITVRNLTSKADRHPLLYSIPIGGRLAIYDLRYDYRSGDYSETPNTIICRTS